MSFLKFSSSFSFFFGFDIGSFWGIKDQVLYTFVGKNYGFLSRFYCSYFFWIELKPLRQPLGRYAGCLFLFIGFRR